MIFSRLLALGRGDGFSSFLTWDWSPNQHQYGILPMMVGSLCVSLLSTLLGGAWAFGIAIFLQVGPRFWRASVSFLVRAMAAVPSIIFALGGVFYVVPVVRLYSESSGYSLVATVLTLSFFLLPFQVKLLDSAFMVAEERVGASADILGFSKIQKLLWVTLPQARAGLMSALSLGLCRALGDTMIALLVSGNAPQVPDSFLSPIRVLTAHIALVAATDSFSPVFDSLFVAVAILLSFTVLTTFLGHRILQRDRTGL